MAGGAALCEALADTIDAGALEATVTVAWFIGLGLAAPVTTAARGAHGPLSVQSPAEPPLTLSSITRAREPY